jgi:uncharacterized damage-inducible protein DinB
MPPEAWLRGPVAGVDPLLQPAAHALLQVREELEPAVAGLTTAQLWARPGQAASIGFHLRHLAGSTGRLLTYARGEELSEAQRVMAARESQTGAEEQAAPLVAAAIAAVDAALQVLRTTPRESLLEARRVGRAGLPSTVLGLLFHTAEHAARHMGQIATTARVVRG